MQAIGIEADPVRAVRALANAATLGVDRLSVVEARAPEGLAELPKPNAIFIGGGLSEPLLEALTAMVAPGTRLVANAVTLESEALLISWQARKGGDLLRIELATATPLSTKRGWRSAYPITQWSVTL
jgi:precorrin-6Y C5,15-methyltransferase (decarboxylating)